MEGQLSSTGAAELGDSQQLEPQDANLVLHHEAMLNDEKDDIGTVEARSISRQTRQAWTVGF